MASHYPSAVKGLQSRAATRARSFLGGRHDVKVRAFARMQPSFSRGASLALALPIYYTLSQVRSRIGIYIRARIWNAVPFVRGRLALSHSLSLILLYSTCRSIIIIWAGMITKIVRQARLLLRNV